MKNSFNAGLRWLVKIALFFFYKRIRIQGKEKIPSNKAVIIIANHQNALIDPLIIATQTRLKPHFLARASAFKHPVAAKLLHFIRMIPVYRVRDGKENMEKNGQTFAQSVQILAEKGSILIFAEGGHSHERSLRYPKKGFTRIAFQALETFPEMDLVILPIGINYSNHTDSGSNVTLVVGKEIAVKPFLHKPEELMQETYQGLQALVTQLPLERYQHSLDCLIAKGIDLSDPLAVAQGLKNISSEPCTPPTQELFGKQAFRWMHWPLYLIWRYIKPKNDDPVFQATLKFLIGFVGYPLFLLNILFVFPLLGLSSLGYTLVALSIFLLLLNRSNQQ
jgi:1-acyl-sn-glycerol-3-phosphate acyltransferase